MDKSEKKALFSFLFIYVGSTVFLLFILLLSYYQKEIDMLDRQCSIEMTSAANMIKADILNSHMDDSTYTPKNILDDGLQFGLFSKDKELIYSNLRNDNINLNDEAHIRGSHAYHVAQIDDAHDERIRIKYIVIETDQGLLQVQKLKIYIALILLFSTLFIGFIGYFLAKLLLKPVRDKIIHMDKFIKDSAHELNTPVAVLLTSASAIKQGRNVDKMINYCVSSAKQISQLYNDMHYSAFKKQDETLDTNINLDELVSQSVEFFYDIAVAKNIKIESNLSSSKVFMDKTKAQKVINNLLSNAIKYSNKGSKVIVTLENSILYVEDYGIGIDKKDQKEIFKRYKRGQNFEGGFGIGLDIVNEVCNEYELSLNLKSILNQGSTFSVDFSKVVNN